MKKKPFKSLFSLRFMWKGPITCLILLFLFAAIYPIHADPGTQGEKISLELAEVTLEKALGEIESHSDYRFMYELGQIPLKKIVSLKIRNQEMDVILSLLFKKLPVTYKIQGRQIILMKSPVFSGQQGAAIPAPAAPPFQGTVTGMVVDTNGMPLLGANVLVKGTTEGS